MKDMQKFNYIISSILLVMLSSCEVDYVFEKGDFKPKVVVNAVFSENQSFVVNLTYSKNILDNQDGFDFVENAEVFIKEIATGRTEQLVYKNEGNYTFTYFTAKADHTYELKVIVPGYDLITATSKVPVKVTNVNVFTENILQDEKEALKVNFNIRDYQSGYYIWNWIYSDNKTPLDSSVFIGSDKFVVSANQVRGINLRNDDDNNVGIKENGFEFLKSFVYSDKDDTSGNPGGVNEKYFLRIMTLSKEMYEYYISVEKYLDEDEQISSISYLPKVYSNVHNGLGLFAGYAQKYIEVKK